MLNALRRIFETSFQVKLVFPVAVVTLLLLSSCETTRKNPDMTGKIIRTKMRAEVPKQPVKPSLEALKLKDWVQL